MESFDRVVVTTGPQSSPWAPRIEGRDEFGGIVIHSQAYKESVMFLSVAAVLADKNPADLMSSKARRLWWSVWPTLGVTLPSSCARSRRKCIFRIVLALEL
jgi:hypothetical protein